ncbi:peptidylprolyl isomerase [Fuerstiella marisgermanici]|nr:peptidylprolyl isomerase [Fuerstiella marisgermanici]
MNIRKFFSGRTSARRFKARRQGMQHLAARRLSSSRMERLEDRMMLAGNVTAQFIGQNAFVSGDDAANSVEILVDGGNLIARGTDGTTINGSADDFVLRTGSASLGRSLFVSLGGGDDALTMTGVTVNRNLTINGGSGNDLIGITESSSIGRNLWVRGGSGNDTVSLQDSTVGRNAHLSGNRGNDLLIVSASTVGRHLTVWGGGGADDVMIDDSDVSRDARVAGRGGSDDIIVRNSQIGDDMRIVGNTGNDIVMVDSSEIADKTRVRGGYGSDNVIVEGASEFGDKARAYGGPGSDNIQISDDAVFQDGSKQRRFEGSTANAAVVDARVTDDTTGAIAAATEVVEAFGGTVSSTSDLSLSIDNSSVSEGAGDGAATITVTRSGDTTEDLVVTLTSSDDTKLQLEQSTVTILAGQTTANVLVNPQDDTDLNEPTSVIVTASATGLDDATINVVITDDDGATLTVVASQSSILEDSGNISTIGAPNGFTYTISRNGDTTEDQVVSLITSVSGVISVPATATIPAGSASVVVDAQTVADGDAEADVTVTLTAAAPGFTAGTDSILVQDNDGPRLTVEFATPTVGETGVDKESTITITRNTDTTAALPVNLTSTDPTSLLVDGLSSIDVVIPAGQTSITIDVEGVEEDIDDGDVSVGVIATATGFVDGSDTIVVTDDDSPALSVTFPSGSSVSEDGGADAITATISRNTTDTSAALSVALSYSGDARLTGDSTVTIPAGASSVNVQFDTIDNNIVDQPANGTATVTGTAAGFTAVTINITVTNDDAASIQLSPASFSVQENAGAAAITVSRTDSSAAESISLAYSNASLITGPATVDFAAGETSKSVALTVIDNDLYADNAGVTVTASGTNHADVTTSIAVINDEVLSLTTNISSNTTEQSVGALLTRQETFTVTGVTAPGATVQGDNDGELDFNEATTTADANGNYSIDIPLTHDDDHYGLNAIQLRAVIASEGVSTMSDVTNVHRAIGTVVRFTTNQDFDQDAANTPDFYDVELLDADAPITVANFLSYTTDTATGTERFDNLLAQRLDDNFIVQAGRYNVTGQSITEVDRDADNDGSSDTIQNEFLTANSNLRGTLSMALPANTPNGGSSEWFINIVDNAFLDNAQHTVFGRVIADGMDVVDAINLLPVLDITAPSGQGALGETPFASLPLSDSPLAGTIAIAAGSSLAVGTGTQFTTQLSVGDYISLGNTIVRVDSIASDTQLTLGFQSSANQSNLSYSLYSTPENDDYVIFTDIGKILDNV